MLKVAGYACKFKTKINVIPCKELTDRTQFGECKQVEVLFMREMVGRLQVSLWPLALQFQS
jgi:hypothetical protein